MVKLQMDKSDQRALSSKKSGNNYFRNADYNSALKCYTDALLQAKPCMAKTNEDNVMVALYSNRAACWWKVEKYQNSVSDVQRALSFGGENTALYHKLLTKLSWSYWHLKDFKKCKEILEKLIKISDPNSPDENSATLRALLQKAKQSLQRDFDWMDYQKLKTGKKDLKIQDESSKIENVTSKVELKTTLEKGRHYIAKSKMEAFEHIIDEECYVGVLKEEFQTTRCDYCFRDCQMHGIPCLGCCDTLYCNEICRSTAWNIYHWFECKMRKLSLMILRDYSLALRILLHAAYELGEIPQGDPAPHTCSSVAQHIMGEWMGKKCKIEGEENVPYQPNGKDPKNGVYRSDYWSIFSLTTAPIDDGCFANFSNFLLKCLDLENKKVSSSVNSIEEAIQFLFNNFNLCRIVELNPGFTIEALRLRQVRLAQTNVVQKETKVYPPDSLANILAILLQRHAHQVPINGQSISVVIETEQNYSKVKTVQHVSVASAVYPALSLMNHSCDNNTITIFTGRNLLKKCRTPIEAGQEVTHCYGPTYVKTPFEERQKTLREVYFFECNCSPCIREKTGTDNDVTTQQLAAFNCKNCSGPVVLKDRGNIKFGTCLSCHRSLNYTASYLAYIRIKKRIKAIGECIENGGMELNTAISELENLSKNTEHLLYKNNIFRAQIWALQANLYCLNQDLLNSAKYSEKSIDLVAIKYGATSIEIANEYFCILKLYVNLLDRKKCVFYFRKCEPLFECFFSPESSEFEELLAIKEALHLEQSVTY